MTSKRPSLPAFLILRNRNGPRRPAHTSTSASKSSDRASKARLDSTAKAITETYVTLPVMS
ncbi:MAG: hypothetical protein QMC94_02755 [Anaerosomatales bacterium]|nr:hypothetical protein [Anaerosomatales bacterium]